MTSCTKIKEDFWSIIQEMETHIPDFVVDPNKHFLRNRKLNFETMLKMTLLLEGRSINGEIDEFFDSNLTTPSASAFCQQRAKLLPDAFKYIFDKFNVQYSHNPTYQGYRLLACDGSECLFFPDKNQVEYHVSCNAYATVNAIHVNAMYDLLGHRYVDAVLQPRRKKSENRAFCTMIDRLAMPEEQKVIFIADRGYEGYNQLVHIHKKNMYFLIRVKDHSKNGILTSFCYPAEPEFDCVYPLTFTRSCSIQKEYSSSRVYKRISTAHVYDYMDELDRQDYDLDLRVVRIHIGNGVYESLITNLPSASFPASKLKELYNMRWGIETSFRDLKHTIQLTDFHGKKPEFIQQEIYARLAIYNFCAAIKQALKIEKETSKYKYEVNFRMLVKICRRFLKKKRDDEWIRKILEKYLLPVRPGRRYHRKNVHKGIKSFLYRN